jgi:antitoxin component HigA of HigAB toxin-antitoxin module
MTLYEKVVAIATDYMGIAAEDYIKRRCSVSCGVKAPADLTLDHIQRLAESIGMTAEVYMSAEKVQEFKDEVLKLK